MSTKRSLHDLQREDAEHGYLFGKMMRHVMTNGWYRVVNLCWREHDMVHCVTYSTYELNKPVVIFCRPLSEVLDGRFEIDGVKRD